MALPVVVCSKPAVSSNNVQTLDYLGSLLLSAVIPPASVVPLDDVSSGVGGFGGLFVDFSCGGVCCAAGSASPERFAMGSVHMKVISSLFDSEYVQMLLLPPLL